MISPSPKRRVTFLEAARGDALAQLAEAWLYSTTHNDLKLMPGPAKRRGLEE